MNIESFQKSPSGRLVKTGQSESAYYGFVPNPLAPELPFDAELTRTLSDADRSVGELAGLGRTMANPSLLIGPFIRREAVLSSRIEGTEAGITDLYAYEAGQLPLPTMKPSPPESDLREVHNYVRALEYGMERLSTLPTSLRLIRELHERLMAGVRGERATPGEFRRSQNWIGPPGCSITEATFVPPPVADMTKALHDLENYLHAENSHPPLVKLALIHYQFEAIHPFLDGNGRIGRLLISLLLVNWNLLPAPLLYLSAFFERHRQTYYDLLLSVSERGAWRDWVLFFLRGVRDQGADAIYRAQQLQDLQMGWRAQLQHKRMTGLVLGITDTLFERPVISANEVCARFKVTHQSAMSALRRLAEMRIIFEVTGKQRNRLFVAAEIFRLVE